MVSNFKSTGTLYSLVETLKRLHRAIGLLMIEETSAVFGVVLGCDGFFCGKCCWSLAISDEAQSNLSSQTVLAGQ